MRRMHNYCLFIYLLAGYTAKPAQAAMTPSERGYGPPTGKGVDLNNSEPLYVDTNAEAVPYVSQTLLYGLCGTSNFPTTTAICSPSYMAVILPIQRRDRKMKMSFLRVTVNTRVVINQILLDHIVSVFNRNMLPFAGTELCTSTVLRTPMNWNSTKVTQCTCWRNVTTVGTSAHRSAPDDSAPSLVSTTHIYLFW